MRKPVRNCLILTAALALALTGCRPPLNLVRPGGPGFVGGSSMGGVSLEPEGTGGMNVSIKWPPPMQRATQAIPAVANTLHLKVTTREGVVKVSQIFNRPATTESLISTASLTVGVGSSLLVQVNAYRNQIATESALPTAEQIIAQGTQENVTITLNATTSVRLQLDPDVTVAGLGGAPSLGLNEIPWSLIEYDPRGPAIWTELNTPENLVYDREGKYLYFTERPDPGRLTEGYRIMRLSLNSSAPSTGSYGVMTLVGGGALMNSLPTNYAPKAPHGTLSNLRGVASDTDGNLYFSEQGDLDRVRRIAPDNTISTFVGGLSDPAGLLVHGDRLYVANRGRSEVVAFDRNDPTLPLWTAGGGTDAQDGASTSFIPRAAASIPAPTALAVLGNSLFVASAQGRVIQINLATVETASANSVRTLTAIAGSAPAGEASLEATTFGVLGGIAASGSFLYLSDTSNHSVWKVGPTPTATLSSSANRVTGDLTAGRSIAQLNGPGGLLISGNTLYICDTGNHRVEQVNLTTSVRSHFAGRFEDGTADVIDGASSSGVDSATLWSPGAIATRSLGTTFAVADTGSNRLRGITSGGVLSTLAGLWDAIRFGRGVGAPAHRLHIGAIAGLCLEPTEGATSPRLYALTSDREDEAGGQGLYRFSGLDDSGAFGPKTYALQSVNSAVTTEMLFENMWSRIGGTFDRVIETPSGIGVDPVSRKVVFSVAGTYHMLLQWIPGYYELAFPFGNLPGQGYDRLAGTGAQGYNAAYGPARLVQLSQPRRVRYDAQGNCYFLTLNGNGQTIVRRVGTNGYISTIAGGGNLTVPQVTGPQAPVSAVQANLGTVADYDIDSQGNLYVASGTRILRLDQRAATMVEVYNATNRNFTSIAFDENDAAIIFAYAEEPKIKKVYLSRLF